MTQTKTTVFDNSDRPYILGEKLGEGGQGIVWKTQYKNILVKTIRCQDETFRQKYYRQLKYLRTRIDLSRLSFAKPLVELKEPKCGYVMEMMEDMLPLEILLTPENGEDVKKWFIRTGGIRRRYEIIKKLAEIFMEIHSAGFCYGDISPNNVFISADAAHSEVQLIDCDNLVVAGSVNGRIVCTPRYGAPELVREESGYNSLTDAWSFAVLVHQLLTLSHPLMGDMVNDGKPELEEKALRGELPWVSDFGDSSNTVSTGIPETLTVFKKLKELFSKTFGGNKSPLDRPGLAEWYERIRYVENGFLKCDHCSEFFLYSKDRECSFCSEIKANGFVILQFMRWDPDGVAGHLETDLPARIIKLKSLPTLILNKNSSITIDDYLCLQPNMSFLLEYSSEGKLYFVHQGKKESQVIISQKDGNDITKKHVNVGPGKRLYVSEDTGAVREYAVHFGSLLQPHRIGVVKWGGQ